jgi:acetolactate synthase-1/2/3 large subunit
VATVSSVMAKMLRGEGIDLMFGVPGGETIDFMEACHQEGIKYVLAKREGNAAFMADMYGQLTGRPGLVCSTLGPGSSNLANGLANAMLDRSPMIAVTGQVVTGRLDTWTHQNINHMRLFESITKMTAPITPQAAARITRRAVRVATASRPGPVHLDLSSDVAKAESKEEALPSLNMRRVGQWSQVLAMGDGAEEVTAALKKARRPIVVAGLSAAREGASSALVGFAEKWGVPVITSAKSKGVMPENHRLFAGVIDMAAPDLVWNFIKGADLILAVGFDPVELIKNWTVPAPVIHIDSVPNTDMVYYAQTEVIGDIAVALEALSSYAPSEPKWDESEIAANRKAIWKKVVEDSTSVGLAPHRVVLECREAFAYDAIVTCDVGSHKLLIGQLWEARQPQTIFQSNGLSSMGFAFPGAIAASLATPGRQVLCMTGDGGFSMGLSDLETAVAHNLPVVTVVFSDGSLNRIQIKQAEKNYAVIGTTTQKHHFARVAEAYGAMGLVAEDAASMRSALAKAKGAKGPVVIEACIDPSEYTVQF